MKIKINPVPNLLSLILAIITWIWPNAELSFKIICSLSIMLLAAIYNLISVYIQFGKYIKEQKLIVDNRNYLINAYDKNIKKIDKMNHCLSTLEELLKICLMDTSIKEKESILNIYKTYLMSRKYIGDD